MKSLSDRFWAKVQKSDGCWLWAGAKDPKGYGKIGAGGRGTGWLFAHRVSYQLFFGEITSQQCVLHACDTPPCVNPGHLFLGDRADNAADMVAKGRSRGQRVELCSKGHAFTADNTYLLAPRKDRAASTLRRRCKACVRDAYKRKAGAGQ